jgi:TolA-binding protein
VEEDRPQTSRQRVTVAQASEILGVTVEAVRGRIKRGTLEHERDSGTVYVLLNTDQSQTSSQPDDDQTTDRMRPDAHADITEELRDRIRYLERQVEEEREARRRADTILAQLSAANAEQARTIRAIEAPQEPSETAEAAEEAPERAEPHSATAETQESSESIGGCSGTSRGSLWRRMFGS